MSLKARQWRTTILLILSLSILLYGGVFLQEQNRIQASATETTLARVEEDVRDALTFLRREGDEAPLAETEAAAADGGVWLMYRGAAEQEVMLRLYDETPSAIFFVNEAQANASGEALKALRHMGAEIGVALTTFGGEQADLVRALCAASLAVATQTGASPTLLMSEREPERAFLQAAYACGFDRVVVPAATLDAASADTSEKAQTLLRAYDGGAVCLRLYTGGAEKLVESCRCFAQASNELNPYKQAARLLTDNEGRKAEPSVRVATIAKAVAYTFSGVQSGAELTTLLSRLKRMNATALFYVSETDVERQAFAIRAVLEAGHDLGLLVESEQSATAEEQLIRLQRMRAELVSAFGYEGAFVVRQRSGAPTDALREAASAGGFSLLTALTNAVRSEDADVREAREIFDRMFAADSAKLQRGQILYFRMGVYRDPDTLSDLAELIHTERNIYGLTSVAKLLTDEDACWTYPVAEESVLPQLRNAIHAGQLEGGALTAIQQRYIGAEWVNSSRMLAGFTTEEIRTLDKTGLVTNGERMAFLTFDDWGTDGSITPLLEVLAAHGVKATFFVGTENVHYNPNLLRAIAAEGHEIACHTHGHMWLATDTSGAGKVFADLTNDEAQALEQDLLASWQTLTSIVGDMEIGGKAALSRLFRPPTLAVSKKGLKTVLDMGFSYSVSGSCSTQDYSAKSVKALARKLYLNTVPGAVLVMHMSDNCLYTAEALDTFLTNIELLPVKRRIYFGRIGDYLPKP